MSDFDKEAEREKLREKYEQEEEKRKTTEQMSELLLKGATMTNAHCGDCGDPIFRYDGQEFCPTCQKPVDRGTGDEAAADDEGEDAADAGASAEANGSTGSENIEVASPSDEASVQFGAGDDATEPPAASAPESTDSPEQPERSGTRRSAAETPTQSTGSDDVRQVPSADPDSPPSPDPAASPSPDPAARDTPAPSAAAQTGGSVADHLAQAQLTLAKTIERHARLGAAADSPRETRDHLETAREAAETLDATDY